MSRIRGYNNDSGLINTRMNGMLQYQTEYLLFNGINTTDQKYYQNEENIEKLLETMNHEEIEEPNRTNEIPDYDNKELEDGGFRNRYDVKPQIEPRRLNLPSEMEKLASGNIAELPLSENNQSDPFKRFISKLK